MPASRSGAQLYLVEEQYGASGRVGVWSGGSGTGGWTGKKAKKKSRLDTSKTLVESPR